MSNLQTPRRSAGLSLCLIASIDSHHTFWHSVIGSLEECIVASLISYQSEKQCLWQTESYSWSQDQPGR